MCSDDVELLTSLAERVDLLLSLLHLTRQEPAVAATVRLELGVSDRRCPASLLPGVSLRKAVF